MQQKKVFGFEKHLETQVGGRADRRIFRRGGQRFFDLGSGAGTADFGGQIGGADDAEREFFASRACRCRAVC